MAASVQVGVRQQRQETRTLDGDAQLALIVRLGAGDARRDDPAVFVDEILQHIDILVIDLLYLFHRETAEFLAAEERTRLVLVALAVLALAFAACSSPSHDVLLS